MATVLIGDCVAVDLEAPGPGTRAKEFLYRVNGIVTNHFSSHIDESDYYRVRFVVGPNNAEQWDQLMRGSDELSIGESFELDVIPAWIAGVLSLS